MLNREEIEDLRGRIHWGEETTDELYALCNMALSSLDMKRAIDDAELAAEEAGRPEGEYLADSIKAIIVDKDARIAEIEKNREALWLNLQAAVANLAKCQQRAAEAERDAERLSKITWAIVHYFEEHPTMINLEGWDELSSAIHDTSNRVAAIDAALREGERDG